MTFLHHLIDFFYALSDGVISFAVYCTFIELFYVDLGL